MVRTHALNKRLHLLYIFLLTTPNPTEERTTQPKTTQRRAENPNPNPNHPYPNQASYVPLPYL